MEHHDSILRPKITLAHIAFLRGWINGLDLGDLAPMYLGSMAYSARAFDLRTAKSILTIVLKELAVTAARNNMPGASALLRQAKRIKVDSTSPKADDSKGGMSFDEYVSTLRDAGEFSHEELVEAWKDAREQNDQPVQETKTDKALKRRERLIKRQLKLTDQLASLSSAPMSLSDKASDWFVLGIADRLCEGKLETIKDLAIAIANDPYNWHAKCGGIGASKAERIEAFLKSHLGDLGQCLDSNGVRWKPGKASGRIGISMKEIAALPSPPLHGKNVLSSLDGSQGKLRETVSPCAISASNDYEAMETWLALKPSKGTQVLYRREVMRLIAWAVQIRGCAMSSLTVEDAIAYRDFLFNIPDEVKTKKGPAKRSQRMLNEGVVTVAGFTQDSLKRSTAKKVLVILSGFFNWLAGVRYVSANPFLGVKVDAQVEAIGLGSTKASDNESIARLEELRLNVRNRVLPSEALDAINRFLDSPGKAVNQDVHARMRFVFRFAYMTGMRISEIASARRAHLHYVQADLSEGEPGGWFLEVIGKRSKVREVPIPEELIAETERYMASRGLLTLPSPALDVPPGTFLVGALPSHISRRGGSGGDDGGGSAISAADGVRPQTIHLALKALFAQAMTTSTFKDLATVDKMRKASAHWLRHTLATKAVSSGAPIDVVASSLGHSNIATTSIYIQTERRRKMSAMSEIWKRQAGK